MRLTPIFVKPLFMGECDECGATFDPIKGGVCEQCRRILCGRHLVGPSLAHRVVAMFGFAPKRCVQCRAGQSPVRVA
jgi:hypothetical protein